MKAPSNAALFCLGWLTACNAVLGLDERPRRETAGAGATSAQSSGPGAGGEPCQGACLDSIPAGWSGPTAVRAGAELARCEGAVPNVELSLHDGLTAEAAQCDCACEPAQGVDCSGTVTLRGYDDNNCTQPEDTKSGALGVCVGLCCGVDSGNIEPIVPDVAAASCAPTVVLDVVPSALWATEVLGCGPVVAERCGADSCYAAPEGHALCIYRAGDEACPDGPFSERSVAFGSYDDTRACAPCGCGPVEDAGCNEQVVGYSDGGCSQNPASLVVAPACTTAPVDFSSARLTAVTPSGSCAPSAGTPLGAATAAEPTTLCCRPDT